MTESDHAFTPLIIQITWNPAELASESITAVEQGALAAGITEVARLPVDAASGTGVELAQDEVAAYVRAAHQVKSLPASQYPKDVLSRVTASLLPAQEVLELFWRPYGVAFDTYSTAENHKCSRDGHLPLLPSACDELQRCAFFLVGGKAKLRRVPHLGPAVEEELSPQHLAGSLLDLVNPDVWKIVTVTSPRIRLFAQTTHSAALSTFVLPPAAMKTKRDEAAAASSSSSSSPSTRPQNALQVNLEDPDPPRDQRVFRATLLAEQSNQRARCLVTQSTSQDRLEAAHIVDFKHGYKVYNGLAKMFSETAPGDAKP